MAIRKLIHYLSESAIEIKPRGKTSFYLDGKILSPKTAIKDLYELIEDDIEQSDQANIVKYVLKAGEAEGRELIDSIGQYRRKLATRDKDEILGRLDSSKSFKHRGLSPIRDVKTGERGLFDTNRDRISDLDFDTWYEKLPGDKELRQAVMGEEILGLIRYDPYTLESKKLVELQGQEVYQFNSHLPPNWRLEGNKEVKPPKFFIRLMEHLFPNKQCRSYAINWLNHLIYDRNQTALLLVSNMGTGKGIFCDIAAKLVGESNAQTQSEGFFKSQFNLELQNKRLVVFDEVPLKEKYKEAFKFLLNNFITIESKGKNVEGTRENFASYIITNNFFNENYLVSADRRFSVPDITDIPLLEVFSDVEVSEFREALDSNPEIIQGIGNYVSRNCDPDFNNYLPYKNEKFYNLRFWSLREWQRFIVTTVQKCSADSYEVQDLKFQYEETHGFKMFPGEKTLANFLDQFRDFDDDVIAKVENEGDNVVIVPSPKYLPDSKEEELPDEFDL